MMKRIYIIGIFVFLGVFVSCEEEDMLTPSGYEKDWMVISQPETDDPVDSLRYDIYEKYGIATYYNDTIGSEERVDMSGNTYQYYEILKVFYSPGNGSVATYEYNLMENHLKLEPVLEYLYSNIFNCFAKDTRFPAFLFVDSINVFDGWGGKDRLDYWYGYNTLAINLDSLDKWDVSDLGNRILEYYLVGNLSSSSNTVWKNDFLNVSKEANPQCQFLYSISETYGTEWSKAFKGTSFTEKEELGFISSLMIHDSWSGDYEATPTENLDLEAFVKAALTYSAVDFEKKYGKYDLVMEKYTMVINQLAVLGYSALK